jgi:hypothetical protein
MPIDPIQIATNRYAPAGSESILMYDTGASGPLTLGQLVQAVCIRSAAVVEAQSVTKMNTMTAGSLQLETASTYLSQIVQETADWPAVKAYLTGTLGIPEQELPDNLSTYDKRIQAANALKAKVDALTQDQQENMIDLQTLVNRRDNAYSTSSNIVRSLATSSADNAQNF